MLYISTGSISSASISGEDVVLKIGSGTKIKNSSGATLTASTAFSGNFINLAEYASTVTKVNASAVSRGISIVGTAAAMTLSTPLAKRLPKFILLSRL